MSIDTYKLATFEQAKLLNNTYPVGSPLRQGVCFSLVLEWTKNHMNKPTDTAANRMAGLRGKIQKAGARQRMYGEMTAQGSSTGQVENVPMKFLGMKSVQKFSYSKFTGFAKTIGSDADYNKKYTEVGFYFDKGAHSMGLFVDSSTLTFFDPNFGEFQFAGDKAQEFFNSLATCYPAIKSAEVQILEGAKSLIEQFGG